MGKPEPASRETNAVLGDQAVDVSGFSYQGGRGKDYCYVRQHEKEKVTRGDVQLRGRSADLKKPNGARPRVEIHKHTSTKGRRDV